MLYRIHDPVANTDTKWDSTSKQAEVIHWPHAVGDIHQVLVNPFGPLPGGEKLGPRIIEGLLAEGTRHTYTVPAQKGTGAEQVTVVHERWYCPDLDIVLLETNDDPRTGTWRNELVNIVRSEPDVTKFLPPAGYVVHHVHVPAK